MVLLIHSYGIGVVHRQGFLWQVAHAGWMGVDLFFVLSGYLITGILLSSRGSKSYFSAFFARRALRIFPAYFAVLMCLLLLGWGVPSLRTEGFQRFLHQQGWLWTFTTNVKITLQGHVADFGSMTPGTSIFNTGHFWSVAVEEQFYWFWPFVVAALPPRRLLWAIAGILVVAPVSRYLMIQGDNSIGAYVFTAGRMDTLSLGALIAVLEQGSGLQVFRKWALPLAALTLGVIASLALWRKGYDSLDPFVILGGYALNGVLFALVLVHVLTSKDGIIARCCSAKVLRFMGKYSYCVYLVHLIIANPLLLLSVHDVGYVERTAGSLFGWMSLVFVVTLTASYAVAFVLWHGLEKHFLSLKRFFPYSTLGDSPAAPDRVRGV